MLRPLPSPAPTGVFLGRFDETQEVANPRHWVETRPAGGLSRPPPRKARWPRRTPARGCHPSGREARPGSSACPSRGCRAFSVNSEALSGAPGHRTVCSPSSIPSPFSRPAPRHTRPSSARSPPLRPGLTPCPLPTGAGRHARHPGVLRQRADPGRVLAPAHAAHARGRGHGAEGARPQLGDGGECPGAPRPPASFPFRLRFLSVLPSWLCVHLSPATCLRAPVLRGLPLQPSLPPGLQVLLTQGRQASSVRGQQRALWSRSHAPRSAATVGVAVRQ